MSWFGGGTTAPGAGATATPFAFGTPTTTAAATGFSTGFGGFNTATTTTAAPAFGFGATTATAAPTFGAFGTGTSAAPAAAPTFGGFGTGTATTAGAAPTFGTGAPTVGTAPTFGSLGTGISTAKTAPAAAPAFGGFGTATPTATAAPAAAPAFSGFGTGIGTGTTTQPAAAPTFGGFGATTNPMAGTAAPTVTTTAAPTFGGFGATPTATAAPTFGGFGTATATTTAPTFGGFGTGTATTIGATTTSTATTVAPTFGGFGTTTTATTSTAAPTFGGFGTGTATTTTGAAPTFGGFGVGTSTAPTATAAPAPSLGGFGLGGGPATSAPTFGGFGLGAGNATTMGGTSSTFNGSVVDLPIPNELLELVDELKTCVKNDKVIMAEVSRASYKTVEQVTTGIEETRSMILNTSNTIQRHTHNLEIFKQQMSQDIRDAEMAQITRETPAVLQSENHLPTEFFYRLFADYENRMALYKREIRKAESAIAALDSNTSLTSRDLCMSLKAIKDSLLVIAAKVKTVHEKVNAEVETHKSLLRFVQGEGPSTASSIGDRFKDERQRWDQQSDEDSAFSSRMRDPAKLYNSYAGGGPAFENPYIGTPQGFGRSSTLFSSRFQPSYYPGFGSATLYQSPSSPILNPLTASPPLSSTISLKRTKH